MQSHFTGVQDFYYWTGSQQADGPIYDYYWSFLAADGNARAYFDLAPLQAVAVREYQPAQGVPGPASWLLALTGGLLAMRLSRKPRR